MFLGTLGLEVCEVAKKKVSVGIQRNCAQKVHFGSIRWIKPQLRSKRTLKMFKIGKKLKFIAQ